MLSAVLPALRHTRTPLVAGVLWFLVAYLWLGRDRVLPDADGSALERRLVDFGDLAGRSVVLAALALAAVLIGGLIPQMPGAAVNRAIWPINSVIPNWLYSFLLRADDGPRDPLGTITGDLVSDIAGGVTWTDLLDPTGGAPRRLRGMAFDAFDHLHLATERVRQEMQHDHDPADGDDYSNDPVPYSMLSSFVETSLEREIPELTVRLQIERESIYNEVDRLNAESELRRAIFLPLIALVCVVAWLSAAPQWLFVLPIPVALLIQAGASERASRLRVLSALEQDVIRSPTLDFLSRFTEAAVKRRTRATPDSS